MPISITKNKVTIKNILIKISAIAFWVLLWQIFAMMISQEILLVSPFAVVKRIFELGQEPQFYVTMGYSFFRITLGFILAVVVGTLLGVCTSFSKTLYTFFNVPLGVIKSTPVASFIILALVWIKTQYLSVFIAFLMVLPMIWANIHQGILSTDKKLLEMGKVFNFSLLKTIKLIYIPSVYPFFLSACTTGLGFAWKSGIAAEVIGMPRNSIGTELYNAKVYLETPDLFAWTVVIILLSMIIEKIWVKIITLLQLSSKRKGERKA